ncbi:uncharacterized protein LOC123265528 [Cotesia glomerata]|uniref:Uncharacterized protein n=1 Tax=Cotesia glomerata TaxID=32391 RepID=A0AAV7IYD4_COTGL|nr:uncharacterized protein LOC123265528 [Cotesia glomerata]KAH0561073.1 hypothetical protein KQX54_012342 [Cotesia glomerata]
MPPSSKESETDSDCSSKSNSRSAKNVQFKISKDAELAVQGLKQPKLIPIIKDGQHLKIVKIVHSSENSQSTPHKPGENSQITGSVGSMQTILRAILQTTQNNTALLNSLSEKVDEQKEMISTLTASINQRQNPGHSASMSAKPDFLPFSTVAEIKEYEGTTEQRRNQLKNYVSSFRGGKSISDNIRYVLKNNFLMKDELLITYNYIESSKGKPNTIAGSTLDRDLLSAFRSMYPNLTVHQYHEAFKGAMKAADSRLKKKKPDLVLSKKRKKTDFTEKFYTDSQENQPPTSD